MVIVSYSNINCTVSDGNKTISSFWKLQLIATLAENYGWESAEILKWIITNFKSIDNQLKSTEVIKSINTGNPSHIIIKKANCLFHIVHYFLLHA